MAFQFLSWHWETVSNFTAAKYGTVSIFVLTWRNGLKFCCYKIWDRFVFAAAKYGTVSIFVLTWKNGLKFCTHKIWDNFDFCPDMATLSNFVLMWRNGLKFCGCKIWDRFDFCPDMAKKSQILQLQNMRPFQIMLWHDKTVSNFAAEKYGTVLIFVVTWQNGLKFCSHQIWDRINFCLDMAKQSQFLQPQNMGPFHFLTWCGKTVSNVAATTYRTVLIFVLT